MLPTRQAALLLVVLLLIGSIRGVRRRVRAFRIACLQRGIHAVIRARDVYIAARDVDVLCLNAFIGLFNRQGAPGNFDDPRGFETVIARIHGHGTVAQAGPALPLVGVVSGFDTVLLRGHVNSAA